MSHQVTVVDVSARPTAVVAATTTWPEFSRLWPRLLDEIWGWLRANGIERGCPNVMLYLDDVPHVEVGVEMRQPFPPLAGRVVASSLPAGRVATTTHRGSWSELGAAHEAIVEWCRTNGETPAGPRWEIYGQHRDDPADQTADVFWLLEGPRGRRSSAAPGM